MTSFALKNLNANYASPSKALQPVPRLRAQLPLTHPRPSSTLDTHKVALVLKA